MNFTKAYGASTTPKMVLDEQEAQRQKQIADANFEENLQTQGHKEWLEHPITQRFLAHLTQRSNESVQQSEDLAQDVNQNQARHITKCLITSQLLKKVITYARERKW